MKFSYIVPALNEENYIGSCIRSINCQVPRPHEVILVDNGSTDKTVVISKKLGARVVRETKRGIAHARNAGAKAARGEVLCFIDADGELSKNWAKKARKHLERGAAAVVGTIVFKHEKMLKFVWYNNYTVVAHTALFLNNFVMGKLHLGAGNLAIKKDVFEKLGGYEPFVAEDFWLSKKFWKMKFKGVYDSTMIVYASSRGFEKRGMLPTVWYWTKSTFIKVDQSDYSYRSRV